MDLVIQKATELGVSMNSTYFQSKSISNLIRRTKKSLHWSQVSIQLCEQSEGQKYLISNPYNILRYLRGNQIAKIT